MTTDLISQSFPNLVVVDLYNCGLKTISAESLIGLERLERLNLPKNELTSIPKDLFVHTKRLKWIDLSENKLKAMSSQVLEPLNHKELSTFDLRQNTKIDVLYDPSSGQGLKTVDELKKAIDSAFKCSLIGAEIVLFEESVTRRFKNLWQLKQFSDFTIVVGGNEFAVHKNVLAVQSSVFSSIFETDKAVKASNKLEIKDCSVGTVGDFMHALYTGKIENKNDEQNALDLFNLASTFDVPELKTIATILALEELNEKNAIKALTIGNLYKSEEIIDAAFEIIKKSYPEVKFAEALKNKPEQVGEIVKAFNGFKGLVESLSSI